MNDNLTQKISASSSGVGDGVFNQFITPSYPEEDSSGVKKDYIKNFLIGFLVFTILLGIGAFAYAKVLDGQVEAKKAQLAHYDTSPEVVLLETNLPEMQNLSQRLKLVNTIYESKVYINSMLFPIIESLVESSYDSYVYFSSFNFKKTPDSKLANVSLSGVAIDYQTLYRQINNFKNNPHIQNLKMGSMSLDEGGFVVFDITFNVAISPTDFIKYINQSLAGYNEGSNKTGRLFEVAPQVPATTTATTTASTSPSTTEEQATTTATTTSQIQKDGFSRLSFFINR